MPWTNAEIVCQAMVAGPLTPGQAMVLAPMVPWLSNAMFWEGWRVGNSCIFLLVKRVEGRPVTLKIYGREIGWIWFRSGHKWVNLVGRFFFFLLTAFLGAFCLCHLGNLSGEVAMMKEIYARGLASWLWSDRELVSGKPWRVAWGPSGFEIAISLPSVTGPITCSFATDAEFMMNMSRVLLEHEGVYSTKQLDLKFFLTFETR